MARKLIIDTRGTCIAFKGNEALVELHPDRFSVVWVPEVGEGEVDPQTGEKVVAAPEEPVQEKVEPPKPKPAPAKARKTYPPLKRKAP